MKARVIFVFAVISFAPVFVSAQNQPAADKGEKDTQQASPAAPVSVNCNCTDQAKDGKDKPQGWHKLVTWPEGIATWALIVTLAGIIWQAVETRRKRSTKIVIPGCIVYRGTDGIIHHTELSYWINFAEGEKAAFHTAWFQSAD